MTDLKALPEVISKDQFLYLLEELLQNQERELLSEQIEKLDLLGEKFGKFYDLNVINHTHRTAIFEILKTATDTSRISLMEDLTGIMFQYRIDTYARYLEEQLPAITIPELRREVYGSIKEYKGLKP